MNALSAWLRRDSTLYFIIVCLSLFLSFIIAKQQAIINPDAICYLLSAETVGTKGVHAAMHLCGQAQWPFYSILVHYFVQLSHLSYAVAAYVLDSIFSVISVLVFLLIVKELGAPTRVLGLAALTILLSHEFNSVRQYIVRDHGFWAFYLCSVLCMLRYVKKPSWFYAISWSASLLIATLFRIEGAIFLLLLPCITFFYLKPSQAIRQFITLNVPVICIGLILVIWSVGHPQSLDQLGRIPELLQQMQHGVVVMLERYQASKTALIQTVLTHDSAREAGLILLLTLLSWYVISVIGNLSWIYALLVAYAWWRKVAQFPSYALVVLVGYLSVNVLVTLGFLLERLFLSKRYLIALSLILMLWVPFALNDLWKKRQHLALGLVTIGIFIASLGGIFEFGYSKSYIREAGDWLATHVPTNATLYANDYQLMYYSQYFGEHLFEKLRTYTHINTIADGKWKQYDYLALRMNQKEMDENAAILASINLLPVQAFSNKRGDKVVIYRVINKRK